ncbi:MAG: MBL fold metallo-hydrolase [Robiginitomaculum sp.]|nr:MAG: MBL fold metallo-hydrolase [Robiginitomaculum sp.]
MKITKTIIAALAIFTISIWSQNVNAQSNKPKTKPASAQKPALPDIKITPLGNGLYMFAGQGGNIGVSNGADGLVVIDDQYARMAPKILAALETISDKPLRFLINTHYHGDHTGGNVEMHKHGADIIAHDNVRKRLSTPTENKVWNVTVQAVPKEAWPVITYSENSTLHLNGQTIKLIHVAQAHTDGDSLVYFPKANVLHMGDNFFNGMLPYIDVDGGGSINGMIAAQQLALSLADENTKIIPGHGPLSNKAELQYFNDALVDMRDLVQVRLEAGDSMEMLLKDNPLKKYEKYSSFIQPDLMAKIIFRSLSAE